MNLLVVALSIGFGLARGRRLKDLADYQFLGYPQFYAALGLQILLGTAYAEANLPIRSAAPLLNLGSMGLLLWALALNWQLWGSRIISTGVFANLAVIFANGAKMPVGPEALRAVGMPASRLAYLTAGQSLTHRLIETSTRLPWLGDILYLPRPFSRSPVFSIGDVLLAAGLWVLIQEAMSRQAAIRNEIAMTDPGGPAIDSGMPHTKDGPGLSLLP